MPELPEVETTRRGLEPHVVGRRITKVTVHRRDLRTPIPMRLEESLKGAEMLAVRRRAKYLLIDLNTGETLLVHLGMSGSLVVVSPDDYVCRTHNHVVIQLDNGNLVVFHDPRRFGVVELIEKGGEATHPSLKNLGPEPFSKEFSTAYLARQLARRKGPIKPVLMDQKLVVGVGNIYASEALYFCGIQPSSPAREAADKSAKIIKAIRATLQAAIDSGGSTLRDYVGAQNEEGYFQHHFQVYARDGHPCFSCSTMIEMSTHAGRSTYWCPQCQTNCGTSQKH
jgi:formamidopyrimidine-DNA glycosylase